MIFHSFYPPEKGPYFTVKHVGVFNIVGEKTEVEKKPIRFFFSTRAALTRKFSLGKIFFRPEGIDSTSESSHDRRKTCGRDPPRGSRADPLRSAQRLHDKNLCRKKTPFFFSTRAVDSTSESSRERTRCGPRSVYNF